MRHPDSSKDKRLAELERAGTRRKLGELKAQEALKFAESIVETVREPLLVLDVNLKVISANHSFYATFKVTPEDTLRHVIYELGNGEWDIPVLRRLLEGIISEKEVINDFEVAHGFREIGHKIMLLNARRIYRKSVGTQTILIAIEDITERRRLEGSLRESEERYRRVFETANDGILLLEKSEGTIANINPAFRELSGYSREEAIGKKLKDVGIVTDMVDFQEILDVLDERDIIYFDDILLKTKAGHEVDTDMYLVDKTKLVQCNIRNITDRKIAERELVQTVERLRKAFGAIIKVLVAAVEIRDPYTAGHQMRSADLAGAIAIEMELPQDSVNGIRMSGAIHDIGKLSVPSQILSKPNKLTDTEFLLIKDHSRRGYEMLKDVEFPWPVAQTIYQHHERMNGTGYPRNLTSDKILMDARIIAVADVVEAMASARPYRPALGLDAALEEIEKNKGILYDNVVADACLVLFLKKGYTLIA